MCHSSSSLAPTISPCRHTPISGIRSSFMRPHRPSWRPRPCWRRTSISKTPASSISLPRGSRSSDGVSRNLSACRSITQWKPPRPKKVARLLVAPHSAPCFRPCTGRSLSCREGPEKRKVVQGSLHKIALSEGCQRRTHGAFLGSMCSHDTLPGAWSLEDGPTTHAGHEDGGVLYHVAPLMTHAPYHESRWWCRDTRGSLSACRGGGQTSTTTCSCPLHAEEQPNVFDAIYPARLRQP